MSHTFNKQTSNVDKEVTDNILVHRVHVCFHKGTILI